MKSDDVGFLYRKEILNGVIFTLGVLLFLVIFIQPGTAVVSANFTAMNQAGMPIPVDNFSNIFAANYSCGDILFVTNNSTATGTDQIRRLNWTVDGVWQPAFDNYTSINVDTSTKTDPVNVSLIVENQTGTPSSPFSVLFYKYGPCGVISANFSVVPAYDDLAGDPNGTISFFDQSYSKLDPELEIVHWWWDGVNNLTKEKVSSSGENYLTMAMPEETGVTYRINLTVGDSGSNYTTISENVTVPPDNVIPIANFSVAPISGIGPTNISVIDQSKSMVNYTVSNVSLSYNYTVFNSSNAIIASSSEVNPVFFLTEPDFYSIKSIVTNWYGVSNETTVEGITISDGVEFSASVREGLSPLNVSLIDQTTGTGNYTYDWKIGNDTDVIGTSTDHNPQFQILFPGKYWVNLSVTDEGQSWFDYENKTDFINVGVERYPQAGFTAVPLNGSYPLNVSFIDQSVLDPDLVATGVPVQYHWTFDDGGESFIQNPTHTFTSADTFNVSMFVKQGDYPGAQQSMDIHVTEPSYSGFNFTWIQDYGKSPYSIVLIPLGITADWGVLWTVEKDGKPFDPSTNFTARYVLPGTGKYNVTLTVSKEGYTSEPIAQTIEVFPDSIPNPNMTMMNPSAEWNFMEGVNTSAYGFPYDPIQFWSNESDSWEDSWYWDFGDNSSSPLRSPVHSYNAPGLYTVRLTSSNVHGQNESQISSPDYVGEEYNVWIFNEAELLNVYADPASGNAPLPVHFNADLSVNKKSDAESQEYVVQWYWDFGDGRYSGINSTSFEQRPNFTYQNPGVYYPYVLVILNDGWGYYTELDPITVGTTSYQAIIPGFTYEVIDRNGTYGYSYKFMDGSKAYNPATGERSLIVSWTWDFGDGSPLATERAPTHLFKEPGTYTVNLTVWDDSGNTDSIEKIITVVYYQQPLTPDFTVQTAKGLSPLVVQFNDATVGGPVAWYWNFGDGTISREQSPIHIFEKPGKYSVSLRVEDKTGFSSDITKSEYIEAVSSQIRSSFLTSFPDSTNPQLVQFHDYSTGSGINSWQWSFGDGETSNERNPQHLFSTTGCFVTSLDVSNGLVNDISSQKNCI